MTTTERASDDTIELAHNIAKELSTPFVPRSNKTIRALQKTHDAETIIVVGPSDIRLLSEGQPPLFFHPSMALVRIKRLRDGGTDSLLRASGATLGDHVLDCTAGLCSDSLVFSYAVGDQGKVIALEASAVLHAVIREGLQSYETGLPDIDHAMRAIKPLHEDHDQYLRQLDNNSMDIVYFDPMFEKPVTTSSSLVPLRSFACKQTLTEESIQQAVRVARKAVVLKERRNSEHFARLGFHNIHTSATSIAYGVIRIDS
ncbi:MAG: class I SAM-dependent methyltransferase [Candidatus Cohnella colombiensis]|uniref:Class I SAM-dependent methyltransferase n=1 Tax=Candidatus Cohnella colombiensis TaxID=3121368 RepID=A0AA95F018_9BACL|nr:MAG: class I SAM-dependent methyltransferase [Cohnella sp.]